MGKTDTSPKAPSRCPNKKSSKAKLDKYFLLAIGGLKRNSSLVDVRPCDLNNLISRSSSRTLLLDNSHDSAPKIPRRMSSVADNAQLQHLTSPRRQVRRLPKDLPTPPSSSEGMHNAVFSVPEVLSTPLQLSLLSGQPMRSTACFDRASPPIRYRSSDTAPRMVRPSWDDAKAPVPRVTRSTCDTAPRMIRSSYGRNESVSALSALANIRIQSSTGLATMRSN
jgi:hypothetical protein